MLVSFWYKRYVGWDEGVVFRVKLQILFSLVEFWLKNQNLALLINFLS